MTDTIPRVPISWGELIDKITILEIKVAQLESESGRANAARELDLLRDIAGPVLGRSDIAGLVTRLKAVNQALWEIEDRIREHERAKDFDPAFIALARSVYQTNDERGRLKREINLILGSALIEEKSYTPY